MSDYDVVEPNAMRVVADGHGLWKVRGRHLIPIDPLEVGLIPTELAERLREWAYRRDEPSADLNALDTEGRLLARELKNVVGTLWDISYASASGIEENIL